MMASQYYEAKLSGYNFVERAAEHVKALLTEFRDLKVQEPKLFAHPDHGEEDMVSISGTIPVTVGGSTCKIPITLWLHQDYPDMYPLAYVTPTPDMEIEQRSIHVDNAGMVYLNYLNEWNGKSSDLKSLVKIMQKQFATNPPVRPKQGDHQSSSVVTRGRAATYSSGMSPPRCPAPVPPATARANVSRAYNTVPLEDMKLRQELSKERTLRSQFEESYHKLQEIEKKNEEELQRLREQLEEAERSGVQIQKEREETVCQLEIKLREVETRSTQLQDDLRREKEDAIQQKGHLETKLQEVERNLQTSSQLKQENERIILQNQQLLTRIQQLTRERDEAFFEKEQLLAELQEKQCQISELQGNAAAQEVEDMSTRFTRLLVPHPQQDSWNVPRDEVKILDKIGRGTWGIVFKGRFRNQTVAVKQADEDYFEGSDVIRQYRREIQVMAHVQHPNIVRFIAAVIDDDVNNCVMPPLLVIELLDENLRTAYMKNDLEVAPIFKDVAYALHYLHEHQEPIIHRDVSSTNILLKKLPQGGFKAKLSDLGTANKVKHAKTSAPGAIGYMAPESSPFQEPSLKPTPKVDVYSYGILLGEVITKTLPVNRSQLIQKVKEKGPQFLKDLIFNCIELVPTDRPTMADVLNTLHRITQ